ncbi:MAG: hypothetical protein ACREQF_00435, partial [Candidatus Binataceae bacterium]
MRARRVAQRLLAFSLAFLIGCGPGAHNSAQLPDAGASTRVSAAPGIDEHDRYSFPGGTMYAYPSWAKLEYVTVVYDDGSTIWARPSYGSGDCLDAAQCKRMVMRINQGRLLEAVSLDGSPVLLSKMLQFNDPATQSSFYVAEVDGKWNSGPDLVSLVGQARDIEAYSGQSQNYDSYAMSTAKAVGVALGLAAGIALVVAMAYAGSYRHGAGTRSSSKVKSSHASRFSGSATAHASTLGGATTSEQETGVGNFSGVRRQHSISEPSTLGRISVE